jgi:hypothetical protein
MPKGLLKLAVVLAPSALPCCPLPAKILVEPDEINIFENLD